MEAAERKRKSAVSNADRCRKYREKRKLWDPTFMDQEKERKRIYRSNRSTEEIERDKRLSRERMKKLKEKRQLAKEDTTSTELGTKSACESKPKPMLTRRQNEFIRRKWREYKRNYRSKLTAQKKRRIRERENKRKAAKKEQNSAPSSKVEIVNLNFTTPAAARKAVSRAKKSIPKEPSKFAEVVRKLIDSASPKKRDILSRETLILTPNKRKKLEFQDKMFGATKSTLLSLKNRNTKICKDRRKKLLRGMSKHLKNHKMMKKASEELGVRWCTLVKWSKCPEEDTSKRRSDALPAEQVETVGNFYLKPYVSVTQSSKQTVTKNGQRYALNRTLKETYDLYKSENPSENISFSKFVKLRPKNVKPIDKQNFRGCLCEKCVNMEFCLKTLNKELSHSQSPTIKDRYDLSRLTLCTYTTTFPALKCVKRDCTECGPHKILEVLKDTDQNNNVSWYKWQTCQVENKKTGENHNRKMLVSHKGTVRELVEEMATSLKEFSMHLFTAHWQYKQFTEIRDNVPDGTLLCVMDFSENYTCATQDEIQSAHWAKNQVTIHPIVSYYGTTTHEIVFISDDINHDSAFVEVCVSSAIKHLKKSVQFQKIIQFTDGCSSQYKSKLPFYNVSSPTENVHTERHFFGTGHGKGPADSCSAVVKSSVTRAVKGGAVINDAQQLFDHVSTHLTRDKDNFKRSFFFVDKDSVNRIRSTSSNLKTLQGTRKLHCVKGVCPGVIDVREFSCLCKTCIGQSEEPCPAIEYVHSWKREHLLPSLRDTKKRETKKRKSSCSENFEIERSKVKKSKCTEKPTVSSTSVEGPKRKINVKKTNRKKTVKTDFKVILEDLARSKSFRNLKNKCVRYAETLEEIKVNSNITIVENGLVVDKEALQIVPADMDLGNILPVRVVGDGNCLPRAISVLGFGSEDRHHEIRARIVIELAIHEDTYIDPAYLKLGTSMDSISAFRIPVSYAMYSDMYTAGDVITPAVTRRILQKEVMNICNLNTYMGIWQIHGLASVINRPVFSVYPNLGNVNVRRDLNRIVAPRSMMDDNINFPPVHIMWSTTRVDMTTQHWVPNHFVPLLPMMPPVEVEELPFDLPSDLELDLSTDLDISLLLNDDCMVADDLKVMSKAADSEVKTDGIREMKNDDVGSDNEMKVGIDGNGEMKTDGDGSEGDGVGEMKVGSDGNGEMKIGGDGSEGDGVGEMKVGIDGNGEMKIDGDGSEGDGVGEMKVGSDGNGEMKIDGVGEMKVGSDGNGEMKIGGDGSEGDGVGEMKVGSDGNGEMKIDGVGEMKVGSDGNGEMKIGGDGSEGDGVGEMKVGSDGNGDSVPKDDKDGQSRNDSDSISVGTYVSIQHGKHLLPGVIVDVENGIELWAQYFQKQKTMWSLEDTTYRLLKQDIVHFIEAPDIVFTGGSRFFYKFNEF